MDPPLSWFYKTPCAMANSRGRWLLTPRVCVAGSLRSQAVHDDGAFEKTLQGIRRLQKLDQYYSPRTRPRWAHSDPGIFCLELYQVKHFRRANHRKNTIKRATHSREFYLLFRNVHDSGENSSHTYWFFFSKK